MNLLRVLLFLLLLPTILPAQIRYWAVTYADFIQEGSEVKFADEGYTLEKTSDGSYLEKFYHSNHQLRESVAYADRHRRILHGPWRVYYANGQEQVVGTYTNNQRTGKWYEYYEDGELWRYCLYEKDQELQCDTLAWIIEDAPLTTDELSSLAITALYTPKQVDSPPLWRGCPDSVVLQTQVQCTADALYSFVYHQLPAPKDYKGEQLNISLKLIVEIDGRIRQTRVLDPTDDALKNWATSLASHWPLLTPAMKEGRPVRCEYALEALLQR